MSEEQAGADQDPHFDPDTLRYNESGLVCAVAQQHDTREVLMVAWMDAEAV